MKTPLLLLCILIVITAKPIGKRDRYLALNYSRKVHIADFSQFESYQRDEAPQLEDNPQFHGMYFQGAFSDHILLGLFGYGSIQDKSNTVGYTNWGGGVAGTTIDYYKNWKIGFYLTSGIGIGCGRFSYNYSNFAGTDAVSVFSDAIYIEPQCSGGYNIREKLILSFECSYLLPLVGNDYQSGADMPSAFPKGGMIGLSIGYQFAFVRFGRDK
jgi:hypothetical protein